MFNKLRCVLFGHRWMLPDGEPGNIGAERRCECGEYWPAVMWSSGAGLPEPTRPAPPMPECRPPREDFSVTKLDVQAGDVVVLRTARHVDGELAKQIRQYGEAAFPAGVKVVVLAPGITLEVVRPV